jgi:hypothetical protein
VEVNVAVFYKILKGLFISKGYIDCDVDLARFLMLENVLENGDYVSTTGGRRIKNLNQVKSTVYVQALLAHYYSNHLDGASICLHPLSESFYNNLNVYSLSQEWGYKQNLIEKIGRIMISGILIVCNFICARQFAVTSFTSTSESTLPYTKTGQSSTKPPKATKLYLGCQSTHVNGPLILRFRLSISIVTPLMTSQRMGLPLYEGASRYLESGLILALRSKFSYWPPAYFLSS